AVNVVTGDFNGDGKTDLLTHTVSGWGGRGYVRLSNGDGTFVTKDLGAGWDLGAVNVVTGDFNGDGKTDLLTRTVSGWGGHGYMRLSNGDGTFATTDLGGGWDLGPINVIAGDFNGDGRTDLFLQAVTGWGGHGYMQLSNG